MEESSFQSCSTDYFFPGLYISHLQNSIFVLGNNTDYKVPKASTILTIFNEMKVERKGASYTN